MDTPLYPTRKLTKEEQLAQVERYPDLLRQKEDGSFPLGNLMVEAGKRHRLTVPPAWAAHVSWARYRGGKLQPNDQVADFARMTWDSQQWRPDRKPIPPQELLAQQEARCAEMTRWLDTYCPEQSAAALSVQDAPAPTAGPEPYAKLNAELADMARTDDAPPWADVLEQTRRENADLSHPDVAARSLERWADDMHVVLTQAYKGEVSTRMIAWLDARYPPRQAPEPDLTCEESVIEPGRAARPATFEERVIADVEAAHARAPEPDLTCEESVRRIEPGRAGRPTPTDSVEGAVAAAFTLHAHSQMAVPFHPAAQLMPRMTDEEFAALRADIDAHGLEQPIALLDGKVLDGRHRELACVQTERKATYVHLPPDTDPTRYVLSHGLHRRHLTPSQRQTLFALVTWDAEQGGDRKSRKIKVQKRTLISTRTAAADLGIGRSAGMQRKASMKGDPEIVDAVESGEPFDAIHARVEANEDAARKEREAERDASIRIQEAEAAAALARREAQEAEARRADTLALEEKQQAQRDARERRKVHTEANSWRLKQALILQGQRGRYGVVMVDPPWALPRPQGVLPGREAENHYSTADLDAIRHMDISCVAADAVLFLWVTSTMLPYAFGVIEAWGFVYHSNVVWVKRKPGEEPVDDPADIDPTISLGHVVRHAHEHLLIARRGKFRSDWRADKGVSSVIYAPRQEHSRKPEAAYQMVESLYPDLPKIELFGRRTRPGWTVWGDEAPEGAP